jgi:glycosyltransferase involved in cell wall biosynthesis
MTNIDYQLLSLSLACAALIIALVVWIVYCRRILMVAGEVRRQDDETPDAADKMPPVSVVIYSYNNPDGLLTLLDQILAQDYSGTFEVIVVHDGEYTISVADDESHRGRRVYHTFIPNDTRNLSRKKLALTLGIKAAQNDIMLLVTSDTRINSTNWLCRMAAPLANSSTDLVIGYAAPDDAADRHIGRRNRSHDRLMDSTFYLASAMAGKTYRGDGDNIAYRRSVFFDHKGFSNTLNLHYGDDDLFVSEISNSYNTAVVVATDAQVTSSPTEPMLSYHYKKLRYDFTSRYTGRGQHIFYGFLSLMLWVWLFLVAAAVALAPLDIPTLAVAGASLLALWIPLIVSWYKVSKALSTRRFMLSVPYFMLWRPLRNVVYRIKSRKIHDAQYAWQSQSH